ncbi:MAG TPA: hypothetical protein VHR55_07570 [Candidatus Limnocylindria bacterium]|nr:hypothetical protein [Candidatus Limnocylindria bacterium]
MSTAGPPADRNACGRADVWVPMTLRSLAVLAVLAVVAVVTAACGAQPDPTPQPSESAVPSAVPASAAPSLRPGPEATPTPTPADQAAPLDVRRTFILVPASIAAREPLPWCGHEIVQRLAAGDVYDAGIRACWLEAYRSGRPAEFVSTGWTIEGGITRTFYRALGGPELEVLYDSTNDPLSGRTWDAQRCASTREVLTDPRGTRVFVERACSPIEMPQPDPAVWPTADERLALGSLMAFAITGDASELSEVPFAEEVALGLADEVLVQRTAEELATPASWTLEREAFRGYAGPFSALDTLARWDDLPHETVREIQVSVGEHPHCVARPVPAPAALAGLRRVSLQPVGQTSCLAWWTVDAYFTDDGEIAAVTLDLWEP